MKFLLFSFVTLTIIFSQNCQSQTIDTLVDIGNQKLHFNIRLGTGIPILFEAGAQNDYSTWNSILEPIAKITEAPIITYDRAGNGKSSVNTHIKEDSKHGIISSIEELEMGLKLLGYDKEIMLVSHSYGGYLSILYASRHPELVKGVVLIDVNLNYFSQPRILEETLKGGDAEVSDWKKNDLGSYYRHVNLRETVKLMEKVQFPVTIPVIDIVRGNSDNKNPDDERYFQLCHKQFVENLPNATAIKAFGCGHGVYNDNPSLVIQSISKLYAQISKGKQQLMIYNRTLDYTSNLLNYGQLNKKETKKIEQQKLEYLLSNLYYWVEYKKSLNSFFPSETSIKDSSYLALDQTSIVNDLKIIEKTGFFSEEFLINYSQLMDTINKGLKNGTLTWGMGEMPSFEDGANEWCNCQDNPDNYLNLLTLKHLKIKKDFASFYWTWGGNFKYHVKAKKENNSWKITYLEGFDLKQYNLNSSNK